MLILSFEHYLEQKDKISLSLDKLHDTLNSFPKDCMGLPTKETFMNKEYQAASKEFKKHFSDLRGINGFASKKYKKELYSYHMNKRKQKMNKA